MHGMVSIDCAVPSSPYNKCRQIGDFALCAVRITQMKKVSLQLQDLMERYFLRE